VSLRRRGDMERSLLNETAESRFVTSATSSRFAGAAGVALLIVLAASKAGAEPRTAEALFREGRQLMAAGNTAEACARFAQSYALEATSGTLLNLARCHENLGKIATAWTEYRDAAALARSQNRSDRAAASDERVAALEPKLARVTIVAAKPLPGLEVAAEEHGLGALTLDVAIPLDPGPYHLRATAPAHRPQTITFEISEAEQRRVEIPALDEEALAAPVPVALAPPNDAPVLVRAGPPPPATSAAWRGSVDLYLGGAGAVLAVGGAILWGVAYEEFQSAKDACNQGIGCADYDQRVATIKTLERVAIGTWIVGGAAIVVSVLHYELRQKPAPVQVAIDPWNRQLGIRGAF